MEGVRMTSVEKKGSSFPSDMLQPLLPTSQISAPPHVDDT